MPKVVKTPLQRHMDNLVKEYGSVRKAGKALRVDPTYLCKVRNGTKRVRGDKALKKLRLLRTETLKPI